MEARQRRIDEMGPGDYGWCSRRAYFIKRAGSLAGPPPPVFVNPDELVCPRRTDETPAYIRRDGDRYVLSFPPTAQPPLRQEPPDCVEVVVKRWTEGDWHDVSLELDGTRYEFTDVSISFPAKDVFLNWDAVPESEDIVGPVEIRIQGRVSVIPKFAVGKKGMFSGIRQGLRYTACDAEVKKSTAGELWLSAESVDGTTGVVAVSRV